MEHLCTLSCTHAHAQTHTEPMCTPHPPTCAKHRHKHTHLYVTSNQTLHMLIHAYKYTHAHTTASTHMYTHVLTHIHAQHACALSHKHTCTLNIHTVTHTDQPQLPSLPSLSHTRLCPCTCHTCVCALVQSLTCSHSSPYSCTCTQPHTLLHTCSHTKMHSHRLTHTHGTIHTLQTQAAMFKIAHLLIKSSLFILHHN